MITRITDTELIQRAEDRRNDLARIEECSTHIDSARRDETLARSGISDLESLISKIRSFQEITNELIAVAQGDPIPSPTEDEVLKRIGLEEAVKKQRVDLEETLMRLLRSDDILNPPISSDQKPESFSVLVSKAEGSIKVQITIENTILAM